MKTKNSILKTKSIIFSLLLFCSSGILFSGIYSCSESSSTDKKEEVKNAGTENSSDPASDKGIGPVTSVNIGALDNTMSDKGKEIFSGKCTACHNTPDIDAKKIGPSLKGVSKRRTPEWIMNQILNPDEMAQKDPIAKELLGIYVAQMANQNLTQDEARAVLEYFRNNDSK